MGSFFARRNLWEFKWCKCMCGKCLNALRVRNEKEQKISDRYSGGMKNASINVHTQRRSRPVNTHCEYFPDTNFYRFGLLIPFGLFSRSTTNLFLLILIIAPDAMQ